MPFDDYETFKDEMNGFGHVHCDSTTAFCTMKQPCSSYQNKDYPTLSFVIGGVTYEVPPEGYLIDNVADEYGAYEEGTCGVGVYWNADYWDWVVLGNTFMRNYYSVIQYEPELAVKFAKSSNPPQFTGVATDVGTLVMFSFACLFVAIGLGIPIGYSIKHTFKKTDDTSESIEDQATTGQDELVTRLNPTTDVKSGELEVAEDLIE